MTLLYQQIYAEVYTALHSVPKVLWLLIQETSSVRIALLLDFFSNAFIVAIEQFTMSNVLASCQRCAIHGLLLNSCPLFQSADALEIRCPRVNSGTPIPYFLLSFPLTFICACKKCSWNSIIIETNQLCSEGKRHPSMGTLSISLQFIKIVQHFRLPYRSAKECCCFQSCIQSSLKQYIFFQVLADTWRKLGCFNE